MVLLDALQADGQHTGKLPCSLVGALHEHGIIVMLGVGELLVSIAVAHKAVACGQTLGHIALAHFADQVQLRALSEWGEVSTALKNSADTLNAIWQKRPLQVAEGIRQAHFETAHIQYNDENALSYTISLALYAARNFYTVHRELAGGKGFADLVFVPRKKFQEKPALIVELKWDKSVRGAIEQIRQKEYFESLKEYQGNMLLVGINYNIRTKDHECVIEELKKDK